MKKLLLVIIALTLSVGMWAEKITLTAADFTVTQNGDWIYDKTEKRVNVELSPEYIKPSADVITIYYNNDKMVKPINPGTYQVYIDIEETDIYAAVTGITSEAWKFDITMPTFVEGGLKFEVTSLDPKTVKVIANDYDGHSFTIPATVSYLENDYAVTAIGENAFAGVGTAAAPADLLLPADWEGTKPAATATLWYGGYFVDYRAATIAYIEAESDKAENSIAEAATDFVGIEGVKQAKAKADAALANAQATADNTISVAADMSAIANAKDAAINKIRMATDAALAGIEAAIAGYKERMKNNINDIAENAKNTIHEYAVADQVKDLAINEIDNAVAEAEASINNNADSEEQVNDAKNDALNKINQQLASVQDYYNQLQAAIAAINKAVFDAEAAINEAADGYDFVEAIQEIITRAKADFEAVKSEASNIISKKNNLNEVKEKEEEFIHEIELIQVKAVENIQTEIQPYTSLKENAIAEILSASQGIKNAELNNWIDAAINDIKRGNQNATPSIDEIKAQILYIINLFQNGKAEGIEEGKAVGKAEAFGTMGEKQNGPAVIVTDQDDKQIILYSPKKVQYIKVSDK